MCALDERGEGLNQASPAQFDRPLVGRQSVAGPAGFSESQRCGGVDGKTLREEAATRRTRYEVDEFMREKRRIRFSLRSPKQVDRATPDLGYALCFVDMDSRPFWRRLTKITADTFAPAGNAL
ncbi:MAG: hypothetical protein M3198_17045 [Actinomycetota bacterium]|nr:hypothetical protein [Actinomycetota bacterium]